MFQRNKSQAPQTRFNSRNINRNNDTDTENEGATHPLFPLAVFIMGIVSCYTTALGLEPMLNNIVLSYAMAFALSIFMIAIALQFPKSYKNGTQGRLVLGYSMVAIFSVLLNFNAIYGIFTAEKLLYDELKDNKKRITALSMQAQESLDKFFDAKETERKLNEAMALLAEEKTNPRDYGYGQKARKLNTETVIPLQAKLNNIKTKYDPLMTEIDTTTAFAISTIDHALATEDFRSYRKAVDVSIDAYTTIGTKTTNLIDDGSFSFEPLTFQHRDVGHLNHSLWSLAHLGDMEGKQASALVVSLLLSFLIDFIVLFVLVLLHKPGKVEKKTEEEEQDTSQTATRQSFKNNPQAQKQQPVASQNIYAKRVDRKKSVEEAGSVTSPENRQEASPITSTDTSKLMTGSDWVVGAGELKQMNGNSIDLN